MVDARTRDRWVVETADRTVDRLERFAAGGGEYVTMARTQYGDDVTDYEEAVVTALEGVEEEAVAEAD